MDQLPSVVAIAHINGCLTFVPLTYSLTFIPLTQSLTFVPLTHSLTFILLTQSLIFFPSYTHINGCLLCKGSHRMDVVVQDDHAHHYSEAEHSCVLALKSR